MDLRAGRDRRGHPENQVVQFLHARGFADHGVHWQGGFSLILHERAPAGHHDDGGFGGFGLDRPGHTLAINIGHTQIGDDQFVRLVFLRGGAEQFQPLSSAGGNHHPMIEVRKTLSHEFPDLRVVINAKNVHRALLFGLGPGARAGSIVDLDTAGVVLRQVIGGRSIHIKTSFDDS